MEHVWDEDHELSVCKVCGLFEGGLTTDCSGLNVSFDTSEEIYRGKLDYRENEGWVNKFSPMMQSVIYRSIFDFLHSRRENKFSSEAEIQLRFGATSEEYNEIKSKLLKDMYKKEN
ncbi:hypothetical protein [Paraliobacillus ryukyuensis]|uniref:hypothetical protein n=1 Tax=Paraliobacillus ryukyuensis TaxID=200904 RepID=UPI0009A90CC1|nr:hypothetical protein [Paraliobacillus ryukyuensis]